MQWGSCCCTTVLKSYYWFLWFGIRLIFTLGCSIYPFIWRNKYLIIRAYHLAVKQKFLVEYTYACNLRNKPLHSESMVFHWLKYGWKLDVLLGCSSFVESIPFYLKYYVKVVLPLQIDHMCITREKQRKWVS